MEPMEVQLNPRNHECSIPHCQPMTHFRPEWTSRSPASARWVRIFQNDSGKGDAIGWLQWSLKHLWSDMNKSLSPWSCPYLTGLVDIHIIIYIYTHIYIFSNEIGSVTVDSTSNVLAATPWFSSKRPTQVANGKSYVLTRLWLTLSLPQLKASKWLTPGLCTSRSCMISHAFYDLLFVMCSFKPSSFQSKANWPKTVGKAERIFPSVSNHGLQPKDNQWRLGFSLNIVIPCWIGLRLVLVSDLRRFGILLKPFQLWSTIRPGTENFWFIM
jgi:hypothetical protein